MGTKIELTVTIEDDNIFDFGDATHIALKTQEYLQYNISGYHFDRVEVDVTNHEVMHHCCSRCDTEVEDKNDLYSIDEFDGEFCEHCVDLWYEIVEEEQRKAHQNAEDRFVTVKMES